MKKLQLLIKFLIVVVLITFNHATIAPSKNKKIKTTKEKEIKIKTGPISSSVFERNLVDEEPLAKDIIIESGAYFKETELKLFNGTVLGYVTPWNNHGYDVAKIFAPKFNIISPVWLQILRTGSQKYEVGGLHDIDAGWIKDVRKSGNQKIKMLPRILFDKFTDHDYSQLLTYADEKKIVVKLIVDICKKYNFDGIVLEVWSTLSARVDDEPLLSLVKDIGEALKSSKFELILVVPPHRKETVDLFSRAHFETLYPYVDGFSLMTYDFSSIQRPGANAPLYWVRNSVEHICPDAAKNYLDKRKKILLGLNLYGNDFTPDGGGPIIGHEYLNLLKSVKTRLQHDEHDVENFFDVKTTTGRHIVFYPSLFSINERLKLAMELGTGISLWEIGQGLDYFYDLF